jgi:hypothetical protein
MSSSTTGVLAGYGNRRSPIASSAPPSSANAADRGALSGLMIRGNEGVWRVYYAKRAVRLCDSAPFHPELNDVAATSFPL